MKQILFLELFSLCHALCAHLSPVQSKGSHKQYLTREMGTSSFSKHKFYK